MLSNLPTIENIIEELGDGISILDGGAGKGSFAYGDFPNCRIVALDVQPVEGITDPQNVERITGDLEELPFKDDEFDFVALNFVLEHTVHPGKVLSEIDRVLKPGGVFYFSIPDCRAFEDRLFRFAYKLTHPASFFRPLPGAHNQRFTVDSIRGMLESIGFGIATLMKYPGGFTWMPARMRFAFLRTCRALGINPTRKGNFIIRAERDARDEETIILPYVCFGCGVPTGDVVVEMGRWRCSRCGSSNIRFRPKE